MKARYNEKGQLEIEVLTDQDRIETHEFRKRSLKFDPRKKGYFPAADIVFKGVTR